MNTRIKKFSHHNQFTCNITFFVPDSISASKVCHFPLFSQQPPPHLPVHSLETHYAMDQYSKGELCLIQDAAASDWDNSDT